MKEKQFSIDFAFILLLFCLFTMSSLAVIYIGSQVYSASVDTLEKQYTSLTALDYIEEKVRQNNSVNMIEVKKIDDLDVLCIHEDHDDHHYTTYIYDDDHQLKELFIEDDQSFDKQRGETIMNIDAIAFELEDDLLKMTVSANDKIQTSYLALIGGHAYETS